jgi:hypothetical protein
MGKKGKDGVIDTGWCEKAGNAGRKRPKTPVLP